MAIPDIPGIILTSLNNGGIQVVAYWNGSAFVPLTSVLPSGTTAVTQPNGDDTDLIATDAFVIANAGGGGSVNLQDYLTDLGIYLGEESILGITLDSTGGGNDNVGNGDGTGPIDLTGAGGVSITDNSANGLSIYEVSPGGAVSIGTNVSEVDVYDTGIQLGGPVSNLDIDALVSGVITATTVLNAVGGYQENGVPVSSNFLADVTLSTAQLLEFNTTNTITAATNNGDGTTTYTGAFANGDANALVGGWYTIAGFGDANDGTFGPVSASILQSITLPNANGITEAGGVSATNLGFQLVAAQGVGKLIVPLVNAMYYTYVTTPFILGNTDNTFVLSLISSPGGNELSYVAPQNVTNIGGLGLQAAGFVDQYSSSIGAVSGYYLPPSGNVYTNTPLVISLTGTTPSLTGGDGSVEVKLQYTVM